MIRAPVMMRRLARDCEEIGGFEDPASYDEMIRRRLENEGSIAAVPPVIALDIVVGLDMVPESRHWD